MKDPRTSSDGPLLCPLEEETLPYCCLCWELVTFGDFGSKETVFFELVTDEVFEYFSSVKASFSACFDCLFFCTRVWLGSSVRGGCVRSEEECLDGFLAGGRLLCLRGGSLWIDSPCPLGLDRGDGASASLPANFESSTVNS